MNVQLNPGSKLPFARLEVNRGLDRRRAFPREVKLTVQPRGGEGVQGDLVRSEHLLVPRLSQKDLEGTRQAEQFMATFEAVDLRSIRRPSDGERVDVAKCLS